MIYVNRLPTYTTTRVDLCYVQCTLKKIYFIGKALRLQLLEAKQLRIYGLKFKLQNYVVRNVHSKWVLEVSRIDRYFPPLNFPLVHFPFSIIFTNFLLFLFYIQKIKAFQIFTDNYHFSQRGSTISLRFHKLILVWLLF